MRRCVVYDSEFRILECVSCAFIYSAHLVRTLANIHIRLFILSIYCINYRKRCQLFQVGRVLSSQVELVASRLL